MYKLVNVTMTLVTVVSVFVVCELPDAVLRLLVAMRRLITGQDNDSEESTTANVDAFIPSSAVRKLRAWLNGYQSTGGRLNWLLRTRV